MNVRFRPIWLASIVMAGASLQAPALGDCTRLPDFTSVITKHGHGHWQDERLIVFSHNGEGWSIPAGWTPIGAERVRGGCARFPLTQAAVLVRIDRFAFHPIANPQLGIRVWRLAPIELDSGQLSIVDSMIASTFEAVARLFPLGLRGKQRNDHSVLVTVRILLEADH